MKQAPPVRQAPPMRGRGQWLARGERILRALLVVGLLLPAGPVGAAGAAGSGATSAAEVRAAQPLTRAEPVRVAEPASVAAAPAAAPASASLSVPVSVPASAPVSVRRAQGAPSSRYRYGTVMGSVANQYSGHPNLFSGFGSDPGSLNPYGYVGNNPATLTDPTGQNPLLAACAVGAAGSVLVDVGINLATGMKVTGSQVLQSAGSGCVFGLVGFGAGKVAGQVVARVFGTAAPEARALASQAAACLANSFTPETRVLTETGVRPIGEVAVGERVWAWDEQTGVSGWRTVTATIQSTDPAVVVLRIAGQELRATPEHPFSVPGRGWVPAGQLQPGDPLRRAEGDMLLVEAVAREEGTRAVINLTVEGAQTFFVGSPDGDGQPVLVHNCPVPHGLRNASAGLREVFAQGSVRGQSIINLRETLTRHGFTQGLSTNKQGYLFTNNLGEEVRIMRRSGGWDIRVRNQFGNYLDEFGAVSDPGATHGISLTNR